jgi:hypothetical protein
MEVSDGHHCYRFRGQVFKLQCLLHSVARKLGG